MPSKNENKPVEYELFTSYSRVPGQCLLLNCYKVAKRGTARNVIMFAMREQGKVHIKSGTLREYAHIHTLAVGALCKH